MLTKRTLFVVLTVVSALVIGVASCTSTVSPTGPDAAGADATAPADATLPSDALSPNPDTLPESDGGEDVAVLADTGVDAATTWSAIIGPAGGTLFHPLGASFVVPAGAISVPTLVTLSPIAAPTNATLVGDAFEVDPPGLVLAMPALLTLPYDPSSVPDGAAASSLAIEESVDTGATFTALSSTQDTVGHTISASTVESGQFAPILVSAGALFITTTTPLVSGTLGIAYSTTFAATGGTPPYSWSTSAGTSTPPGLAVTTSGLLSGTPSTVGHYSFFVRVADSDAHVTQTAFTMDVNPPNNPAPVLISLSPSGTLQGTAVDVTLTGSGFVPTTTAQLAGDALTTMYVSATEVIAVLDASDVATSGSYTMTAVNPTPGGGMSGGLAFTVTAVAQNPAPSVSTITPAFAPVGSPDTQVTVGGSNFIAASAVLANGNAVASTYVSTSQLLALIPAADLQDAGTIVVTVQNPPPGGGTSSAFFAVGGNGDGSPIVTSITPTSTPAGSPITITLNGSGFVYSDAPGFAGPPDRQGYVLFDGHAIATTYVSSTQVTGTIHPALIQQPHAASVTYANARDGGTLESIGNSIPFDVTDAGGNCGGACGTGQICQNNACCVASGAGACSACCSGASSMSNCASICQDVGNPNPVGSACFCCTGTNIGGSICL